MMRAGVCACVYVDIVLLFASSVMVVRKINRVSVATFVHIEPQLPS